MNDYIDRLDKVIVELNGKVSPIDLNYNTDLIDDLGFDSINIISLVICLEKEFEIEIPDEFLLLENLRSYAKVKEMIINQVSSVKINDGEDSI